MRCTLPCTARNSVSLAAISALSRLCVLRTGWMSVFKKDGREAFFKGEPGIGREAAEWIGARGIAAVGCDNWGVEVIPNETHDCFQPLHMIALRNTGLLFGEIFQLDDLAAACAADGNYAFLFAAPPLPITGAVGSPINPLAIR